MKLQLRLTFGSYLSRVSSPLIDFVKVLLGIHCSLHFRFSLTWRFYHLQASCGGALVLVGEYVHYFQILKVILSEFGRRTIAQNISVYQRERLNLPFEFCNHSADLFLFHCLLLDFRGLSCYFRLLLCSGLLFFGLTLLKEISTLKYFERFQTWILNLIAYRASPVRSSVTFYVSKV
jgi:hypothetical protein